MKRKPIICIDFDGVIHDYKEGWKDGSIYGEVVPGFFEWAAEATRHFKLVIYSSRSKTPEGIAAMRQWIIDKNYQAYGLHSAVCIDDFEFASEKPPAFLTIDDRCIRFDGNWSESLLQPEELLAYKTWTQK